MNCGISRWILCAFVICFVAGTGRAEDITVSAAISMKDALGDAGAAFEKATGDHVSFNFLASGPLMKQIEQGAPVDVYISAAREQMDELEKKHLIDQATRKNVARGELVLIVPADSQIEPPKKIDDLTDGRFKRIGIGDPASVPAGRYATESLHALHLSELLKSRLQIGINVRQVLDYVEKGEVDAGLVYRTDAIQAGDKVHVVCVVPDETHTPIEYPAAVIKESKHAADSEKFLDYLLSAPGRSILAQHGFVEPVATTQAAP